MKKCHIINPFYLDCFVSLEFHPDHMIILKLIRDGMSITNYVCTVGYMNYRLYLI